MAAEAHLSMRSACHTIHPDPNWSMVTPLACSHLRAVFSETESAAAMSLLRKARSCEVSSATRLSLSLRSGRGRPRARARRRAVARQPADIAVVVELAPGPTFVRHLVDDHRLAMERFVIEHRVEPWFVVQRRRRRRREQRRAAQEGNCQTNGQDDGFW